MKLPPFFETGHAVTLGEHQFEADEIISFARKFDPQPFHLDAELARESAFGALCASGWHTASVWMRKQRDHSAVAIRDWVEAGNPAYAFGPSPGFEKLRWPRPVFAGETIVFSSQTLTCRASASRPGWYVATGLQQGHTLDDELVLSFQSSVFINYPAS
ncbi:MAG: dehydratase [Nitratireductor sp.]|nr:dehydratase [Nitratireductor sp.]